MKITWLLIKRDFIERVRQRSFIIGTLLGVLFILGFAFVRPLFGALAGASIVDLVVATPDVSALSALEKSISKDDFKVTFSPIRPTNAALPDSIRRALDAKKFDAALIAYRQSNGQLAFAYYPKKSDALSNSGSLHQSLLRAVLLANPQKNSQAAVERQLSFTFAVHSLNERYKSDEAQSFAQAVSYFLLIMLYIAVIVYGVQVAHGVIEEKANRIMEVMIGAVRPSQLLTGKIFGVGAVALLQLSINAAAAAGATILFGVLFVNSAGATAAEQARSQSGAQFAQALASVPWSSLVYLVVFFVLGFFTYAAIYAGMGSLMSKPEEVQQYSTIVMMPIIAAYILAIFSIINPDMPVTVWGSMIPLISPLLMFTRISTSAVPGWQIAISIGGELLAIWGLTIFAGKLYRVGVLMYGKPPKPSEILRALRART